MKTIWKYKLDKRRGIIEMPKGAEILSVQIQNQEPCMWALVDSEKEKENRDFVIYGTGDRVSEKEGEELKYIGTFQLGNGVLVFHLFEQINK